MALTAKQEAFAQAVASGMTALDAYRANYHCRRRRISPEFIRVRLDCWDLSNLISLDS